MEASVIVLSAGRGERMCSSLPKALHPVGGKPILARVLTAVQKAGFQQIHVVTKYAEHLLHPVIRSFQAHPVTQSEKQGTAAAVESVPLQELKPYTLILNGDHPLIDSSSLKNFFKQASSHQADISIGSCVISDPKNYGRVARQGEQVSKIIEAYDLDENTSKINEINTGLLLIRTQLLADNLKFITNDNPKEEYPLTDIISLCFEQGCKTVPVPVDVHTAFGVNTQEELASANAFVFEQKTSELMKAGVIFPNPHQVHIEEDALVGQGSIIYPGVYLKGRTHIGSYCAIEQNCFIFDSIIEDSVYIKASSYLEKTHIQSKSIIGPFAHLRPGSFIGKECKIGNFVEIKNTRFGDQSKAGHFCYLGDASIGKEVNIGAGTISCNYAPDKKKHKTKIKDRSFIGSGSMLVAPVEIGEDSLVGAGSVITKNVPSKTLALSRTEQKHKKKKNP